jgi:hypothetical protein
MVIHDLSMGGMRLEPIGRAVFKPGDLLTVDFRLDDENKSTIRTVAIVKSIGERDIGVEFVNPDEHTRKILGFYLMP